MSVFFRTGENTAASVSWPVYLFGVLPLQMLISFYKAAAYAVVFVVRGVVRLVRGQEENGPPAA
jgi:hypothetical protein